MYRSRRLIFSTATAVSAVLLLSSSPALAGATAPPPTRGFATYNRPSIVTTCESGRPTKVTFAFRYNAAKLRRGYWLKLSGYVGNPATLDQLDMPNRSVRIRAGAQGMISRTLAVPAAADAGWQVGLWAQTSRRTSDYQYVVRSGRLSCTHTTYRGLLAAKVTVGSVNCRHVGHLTFDNSGGNTPWYYTIFVPGGGFIPSGHAVRPGQVESRRLTGLQAGEVINVDMTSSAGAIYAGRFRFRQGC
jgi:hypothetical protein